MLATIIQGLRDHVSRSSSTTRLGDQGRRRRCRAGLSIEVLEGRMLLSNYYVSTTGSNSNNGSINHPFRTIQYALNVAWQPCDTIFVRGGTYKEKLTFPHSGSAKGGFITLEAYQGEHPVLSGKGVASSDVGYGNDMVQMINVSYVRLMGFTIVHDRGSSSHDASGVHVEGSGSSIVIMNNIIHDILGFNAMGISVYGSSLTTPISNVVISGNQVYHCQPAQSESLTLDGNVTNFQITNNLVHDNNNIGIDMIGGESSIFGLSGSQPNLPVTRNGVVSGNIVYHIHANYGGGFAAGIYVDGGQNITIEDNISHHNDLGIEVGAENHGYTASRITVENNVLYDDRQGGLVVGGYAADVGEVQNCRFSNNTVYKCDQANTGDGQLWIQYASNNLVANNIFVASANDVLIGSFDPGSNVNNTLDNNLDFAPHGADNAQFNWNGKSYGSYSAYQKATGEDAHSPFGNPLFARARAANFHLTSGSPAIRAGSSLSGWFAPLDFNGKPRSLPPDIGAYEFS